MLLSSSAEMSRPQQFHMSRPKRNFLLIIVFIPHFLKLCFYMLLGVLLLKVFNDLSY